MIGNAAAALQGAPVSTVDVDFFFRRTPANLRKLKAVARAFDAMILRPYYPISGLFRLMAEDESLQNRFHGGETFLIASLADIIASKRAANRPRDRSVIDALTMTLEEKKTYARRETRSPKAGK